MIKGIAISRMCRKASCIFCFLGLVLNSCTCDETVVDSGQSMDIPVCLNADLKQEATKTSLSGAKLRWKDKDVMGVFIGVSHNNCPFTYTSGSFYGHLSKTGDKPVSLPVYGYYPYSEQSLKSTIVEGNLPQMQTGQFHSTADYMVADAASVQYDEDNMPDLKLTFGNHLFSILKITVTNTSDSLSSQKLLGVRIKSASKILSGDFKFDVTAGSSAKAVFSDEPSSVFDYVEVDCSNTTRLVKNQSITLYAIIPSGTYPSGDISVTVYTEKDKGTVTSCREMSLNPGTIYTLEPIDVASLTMTRGKKTVLLFGDSLTQSAFARYLQSLLGNDWKVYGAGVSGNTVQQIMARQGAVPLYLDGGFTIPASSTTSVKVGKTFHTTIHTDGSSSDSPDVDLMVGMTAYNNNSAYCDLTNTFMIKGIECQLSYTGGYLYLKRITDGEAVVCPSGDFVLAQPYASWNLNNPTVTVLYMGTNGRYDSDEVLAGFYRKVQDNTAGEFIAVGYHNSYWKTTYRDVMEAAFYDSITGKNRYLDLRTQGCLKAETIMNELGLELTDEDRKNIANNVWPMSWLNNDRVHPNATGAKAYACLVYYKMRELGVLDL